jgi:hypothetical protein
LASGVVDVGAGASEDAVSAACAPADNADRMARVRSFIEFSERVGPGGRIPLAVRTSMKRLGAG